MFEIYAYGNVDSLTGVFNAIAAIMGGAGYFGLIKTVAVTGVLVAAFAGLFTPGRFHGWGWLMGFLITYYALFVPKADVVIVDMARPDRDALDGIRHVTRDAPRPVVMFVDRDDPAFMEAASDLVVLPFTATADPSRTRVHADGAHHTRCPRARHGR